MRLAVYRILIELQSNDWLLARIPLGVLLILVGERSGRTWLLVVGIALLVPHAITIAWVNLPRRRSER